MSTAGFTPFGPFELASVNAGSLLLDGGGMFGVVPKALWEKASPPDKRNRIRMQMRSLLIRSRNTDRLYLTDCGAGTKLTPKMAEIYGLDGDRDPLIQSLEELGIEPGDITDLLFTHLHFDHCGGATRYDPSGRLLHNYPNARYHVHERHLQTALNPNPREGASFMKENIEPIVASGQLQKSSDQHIFEPGLSAITVNGHTAGQQLPHIEAGGQHLLFAADLIPTVAHLPLPWIMAYDMEPLKTLDEKQRILSQVVHEKWFLFMEHDASHEVITVCKRKGKFGIDASIHLSDLG
ncbi:MAG: MBL fold metallo-hydrolase [Balneolaceae bacterium]